MNYFPWFVVPGSLERTRELDLSVFVDVDY